MRKEFWLNEFKAKQYFKTLYYCSKYSINVWMSFMMEHWWLTSITPPLMLIDVWGPLRLYLAIKVVFGVDKICRVTWFFIRQGYLTIVRHFEDFTNKSFETPWVFRWWIWFGGHLLGVVYLRIREYLSNVRHLWELSSLTLKRDNLDMSWIKVLWVTLSQKLKVWVLTWIRFKSPTWAWKLLWAQITIVMS